LTTVFLNSTATVLGLFEEFKVADEKLQLELGDKLVAYTDGITEACNENGELFGLSRLTEMVAIGVANSPKELVEQIIDAVGAFQTDRTAADDTTIWLLEAR
jgi:sigma-B regulation protein RsbU (phosphoserine phosphatase)